MSVLMVALILLGLAFGLTCLFLAWRLVNTIATEEPKNKKD
ncbi:MAG: hypothetical protein O3A63_07030 [Proteobacteria bacterium]|nr:hypothetical protein [Pseudomonadota bacterium]